MALFTYKSDEEGEKGGVQRRKATVQLELPKSNPDDYIVAVLSLCIDRSPTICSNRPATSRNS